MRIHRVLIGFLVCFAFLGGVASAQNGKDQPKASGEPPPRDQVELHRLRQCGEIWHRVGLFLDYLEKNDDLDGMIIVDNTRNPRVATEVRRRIAAAINHRKFDLRRITFIEKDPRSGEEAMVEFGGYVREGKLTDLKPVAQKKPVVDTSPAETSEPFVWSDELEEKRFPGCQKNPFDLAGYASYLRANPAYRGKIEIDERSLAGFNRKKLKMSLTLSKHGMAKNRITYVLNRVDRSIMADEMTSTLWIIPIGLQRRDPNRLTMIGKMNHEPELPTPPRTEGPVTMPPPKRAPGTISGGVLNARAITLPAPKYPPAARAVKASGAVTVQVLIDENGNVLSATFDNGHPLLRAASVEAARAAKFTP